MATVTRSVQAVSACWTKLRRFEIPYGLQLRFTIAGRRIVGFEVLAQLCH
jgi:hypothetical protein